MAILRWVLIIGVCGYGLVVAVLYGLAMLTDSRRGAIAAPA